MRTIIILFLAFPFFAFSQDLYFPPLSAEEEWETMNPEELGWCQNRIDSLYNYLESNNSKSFILLKDGKIVLEKYFNDHTVSAPWQWASAGKSLMAALVGKAQENGFLSINDKTSDYLGEGWTSATMEQENAITIKNQLTMTSGLDDQSVDPYCTDPECLIYLADAGTRWAYHNGPYTLLGQVIENATGTGLNIFLDEQIKQKIGMTGLFVPVNSNRVFFSDSRSMARYGLLMLNNGIWDENTVLADTEYVNAMTTTSQDLNYSYGYLWWLNGKENYILPGLGTPIPGSIMNDAPDDTYMALGKDGQFLNVAPSENMVWIRMGNAPSDVPVPHLLNNTIWDHINQLACPTSTAEIEDKDDFVFFPNPASHQLTIDADKAISKIELRDIKGRSALTSTKVKNGEAFSIGQLLEGHYILSVYFNNGTSVQKKVLILR